GRRVAHQVVRRGADPGEGLPGEAATGGRVEAAPVEGERGDLDVRHPGGADLEVDEVAAVEEEAALAEVGVDEGRREADLVAVAAGVIARGVRQAVHLVHRVRGAAPVGPADPVGGRPRRAGHAGAAADDPAAAVAAAVTTPVAAVAAVAITATIVAAVAAVAITATIVAVAAAVTTPAAPAAAPLAAPARGGGGGAAAPPPAAPPPAPTGGGKGAAADTARQRRDRAH